MRRRASSSTNDQSPPRAQTPRYRTVDLTDLDTSSARQRSQALSAVAGSVPQIDGQHVELSTDGIAKARRGWAQREVDGGVGQTSANGGG